MDTLPVEDHVLHINRDLKLHLREKLGAGGYGAVFRADRITDSRVNESVIHTDTSVVATKIFPSRYAQDPVLTKRFFREGEYWRRLEKSRPA